MAWYKGNTTVQGDGGEVYESKPVVEEATTKAIINWDNLLPVKTNYEELTNWALHTYNVLYKNGPTIVLGSPLPYKESAALAMCLAIRDLRHDKWSTLEIEELFHSVLGRFS